MTNAEKKKLAAEKKLAATSKDKQLSSRELIIRNLSIKVKGTIIKK